MIKIQKIEEYQAEAERGLYLPPTLYSQPEDFVIDKVYRPRSQPAQATAVQKYVNEL